MVDWTKFLPEKYQLVLEEVEKRWPELLDRLQRNERRLELCYRNILVIAATLKEVHPEQFEAGQEQVKKWLNSSSPK